MKKVSIQKGDAVMFKFAGTTEKGNVDSFYQVGNVKMAIVFDGKYNYPVEVSKLIKI